MRSTPTATVSVLGALAVFCMAVADEQDTPLGTSQYADHSMRAGLQQPWQTDDGIIHFLGRTYDSWRAFHAAREREGDFTRRCGVPNYHIDDWRQLEGFMSPSDCSMTNTNPDEEYDPSVSLYRIPCVVHVIRNANGSLGNITESKVESGIRILNEDFKALAGTNGANGTDCQIEFYLAEVDPDGQATNGITYSNNTSWYNDSGSYYESLAWDPSRYMNIYTNTASGALGYVPWLPQEGSIGSNADRVVVLWECYGEDAPIGPPFNLGRTLTHEVGHYLGLHHTFNDGCGGSCSSSGDLVCDTAPQPSPTSGCNGSSCSGTPPDDNYMDYSDDQCMEQFTPDQSRRMRCTILNYRVELAEEGEGEPDYLELVQAGDVPDFVDPAGTTLQVRINELETGGYVAGSGRLHYSTGSGTQEVALAPQGGGLHAASTSSLECGATLAWYFTAEDAGGTTHRLPTGNGTYSATVALGTQTTFSDDGETDPGYTIESTANDGAWDRGVPVNCDRGAPSSDGDGSGSCWLTDNSAGDDCDSDVDGGYTRLISPPMDATGTDAEIVYVRHFNSTPLGNGCPAGFAPDCQGTCFPQAVYDDWQGDAVCDDGSYIPSDYGYEGAPAGVPIFMNCSSFGCDGGDCSGCDESFIGGDVDTMTVEITSNGDTWVEIDRIGTGDENAEGGWVTRRIRVADHVSPSTTVRVRFTVLDSGEDSVVEAAVDGLTLQGFVCDDTPACPGDLNEDGTVDGTDLSIVLGFWSQSGGIADINGDGQVDGNDLAILLGGWGSCGN